MNLPQSVTVYDRLEELQQAAADAFAELVLESLEQVETFRVALSGGSTPRRVYELIARQDLPWDRIHWYWGDERNVPPDDPDSNYRMVRQALLDRAGIPAANIHPVPVNVDAPSTAAAHYERTLQTAFAGDRFPPWNLVLLGLGDDAHTASLFPQTAALTEHDRWFVANWVEQLGTYRYTLTAPAINSGQEIWFLVAGAAKRAALAAVLADLHDPVKYPAQLIHPTRWMVNRDAT